MARREYKGAAPETALTSGILAAAASFNVDDGTGYPTGAVGPFFIAIDKGTAAEEKILCASRTGNAFSCPGGRGADDTVAVDHAAGAKVHHVHTKTDADEANAHVNATTGVHGKTSALASLNDVETLTNKTMSGGSNTLSAIPQSAITALVTDLAAKVAKSAVHDTWEAIIAAAPGVNWQAALAAALDADAATVLGAMGTGWPAILGAAPGSGWANALDSALSANWQTALGAALAGDWPNVLDSPINGGWLNAFAVDPASLRPVDNFELTNDTTASLTYVPGTTNGVAFTAPPSGIVIVTASGSLGTNHASLGEGSWLSYHVRNGGTIGSGTDVVPSHDDRSAKMTAQSTASGFKYAPAMVRRRVTGLTPGNSYNVVSTFRVSSASGGGVAAVIARHIMVEPVI
jgi:hypothetical protein